jgi:hypothetical protein
MSENTTTTALDRLRSAVAASSYEHRALTVVHRWYCGYEAPHMNLGHQGELVTGDFTMHRPPEGGLPSVPRRSVPSPRMATAWLTWRAMSGSGRRIGLCPATQQTR